MDLKGIVFDLNGTLIWDTKLHNKAWDIFLEKYDMHLTDETKHEKIHGKLNSEIFNFLFNSELTEKQLQNYIMEKELIYQGLFKETGMALASGTIQLFEALIEHRIPFTIATASGIENINFYLKALNLEKWFDPEKIVYNDGSMRGKPHPDLFLKAMEVLKLRPEETVIFEDSVSGILAAEASKAGKIVIINSNDEDYMCWEGKHLIVTQFNFTVQELMNQ